MDNCNTTIRRITGVPHRFASFAVLIDGVVVGKVRAFETVTVQVPFGKHSILIKMDWCRSNEVEFDAVTSGNVDFECGCILTGWRTWLAAYYCLFHRKGYLWCRRTEAKAI